MTTKQNTVVSEAPPEDQGSVEIDGDKAEIVHDFARIRSLREQKLRIVTRDGRPVEESQPEWHYFWSSDDDLQAVLDMGYEIVTDKDVRAPAQSDDDREKSGRIRIAGELTLTRWPTNTWNAYNEWVHENETCRQEREIEELMSKNLEEDREPGSIGAREAKGYGGLRISRR